MDKYILAAFSSPMAGVGEEFGTSYREAHLPDVCAIPGITSARLYEAEGASIFPCPSGWLALYEVETDDPKALMDEMIRRSQAGEVRRVQGIDQAAAKMWLYKQVASCPA